MTLSTGGTDAFVIGCILQHSEQNVDLLQA